MQTDVFEQDSLLGEQLPEKDLALQVRDVNVHYAKRQVLHSVSLDIPRRQVTALIGPSGCGKSTLLRCLNRLNDLLDDCDVTGQVLLHGDDIYQPGFDVVGLRRNVGMVFQKPNPFPKSIYENVAYGPRLNGKIERDALGNIVNQALQSAALWEEVKDRLHTSAMSLSLGQQQRLVIARALAVKPDILLLDEPGSNLDPISMLKLEELIVNLKQRYTIVIVTHNMQQAARVSDYAAFIDSGSLIEHSETQALFTNPRKKKTEDYITGRYG